MKHIPNILSALRIALVGVFIYFFAKAQYVMCLITFALAFITDLLDGYLARRNGWITDVGKVLDPLADKLMVLTALTCFYAIGWLPLWMLIVVYVKELAMIIGGLILYGKNIVVYADWFGKIAGGCFNLGIALTLAKGFLPVIGSLNLAVLFAAIVFAFIALVHYAKRQVFSRKDNPGSE